MVPELKDGYALGDAYVLDAIDGDWGKPHWNLRGLCVGGSVVCAKSEWGCKWTIFDYGL